MYRIRSMTFACSRARRFAEAAAVLAIGLTSASCASAADPTPPASVQVMVRTANPSPGDAAQSTARQVASTAQVPVDAVRYLAASGGDWHALSVRCDTSARCDDVVARLAADKAHFSAVTRDERRQAQTGSAR